MAEGIINKMKLGLYTAAIIAVVIGLLMASKYMENKKRSMETEATIPATIEAAPADTFASVEVDSIGVNFSIPDTCSSDTIVKFEVVPVVIGDTTNVERHKAIGTEATSKIVDTSGGK